MEKEELREHLTTRATWMRGLYILLFAVIYSLAELVLIAVVVFQFLARLITGEVNARLLEFGQQLSRYLYDMLRFFTFNSDDKPYPFASWNKASEPGPAASTAEPETASAPTAARKPAAKKKAATKRRAVAKRRAAPKKVEESAQEPAPGADAAPEQGPSSGGDDTPPG